MPKLGYLIDDRYLNHDPGSRHPESPKRLTAIREALSGYETNPRWRHVEPRPARLEELELVHRPSLLDQVEKASQQAPAQLDADTVVSSESYRTALLAAGGVLECVDAICAGDLQRAFAFVRPPGHHAEPDRAMGFCLFNNVALGAAYARVKHGLERVAVVDIDLHHGNGTQACFYDDPHVLYLSSHQFPFYPGTGAFNEIGLREGRGHSLNFPLPEGAGDATLVPIYAKIVGPILEQFKPELILVSAGFDAHFKDPLGGLTVTDQGYGSVAASLIRAADRTCNGKICFALEGGYNFEALRDSSRAVMQAMEAESTQELSVSDDPLFHHLSARARRFFGDIWQW